MRYDEQVELVPKSALESANAEIEKLKIVFELKVKTYDVLSDIDKALNKKWERDYLKLESENTKLRAALEYFSSMESSSNVSYDANIGKIAREALEKLK